MGTYTGRIPYKLVRTLYTVLHSTGGYAHCTHWYSHCTYNVHCPLKGLVGLRPGSRGSTGAAQPIPAIGTICRGEHCIFNVKRIIIVTAIFPLYMLLTKVLTTSSSILSVASTYPRCSCINFRVSFRRLRRKLLKPVVISAFKRFVYSKNLQQYLSTSSRTGIGER